MALTHLLTQRMERESDPVLHEVRTLAERPHSLHTEWINDWTAEIAWASEASEYEVELEDPVDGYVRSFFTTEPFFELGYWHMPYFREEEDSEGNEESEIFNEEGSPNELSARIKIRAYNAEGQAVLSKEFAEVTFSRDAIPVK